MATPDGKAAGGKEIDLYREKPGLMARVGAGLKMMVGIAPPDGWFGPGKRMDPIAPPEEKGRQFDYPFATNVTYTPRGEQGENTIDFTTLRRLADPLVGGLDLLRLAIETRKDQMAGQKWVIRERGGVGDGGDRARTIESALRKPDGVSPYRLWQRMLLEDLLVIDAPAIYINRTRGTPKLPPAPKVDADGNILPEDQQQGGAALGGGDKPGAGTDGKAPPFGQKALPPAKGKNPNPFAGDDEGDDARAEGERQAPGQERQGDSQARGQAQRQGGRQGWGEESARPDDGRGGRPTEGEDVAREEQGQATDPRRAPGRDGGQDAQDGSREGFGAEDGSEDGGDGSDAQGAAPEGEGGEGDGGAVPGAEGGEPQLGPDGEPVLGPDGKPVMLGPDGKPKLTSKLKPKKRLPTATADDVGVLLEAIDGATLKRLVSLGGRVPRPPEAAYLQVLKGMPAFEYASDEMIYAPRNLRTNHIYGYSPVEQVITTINIALRRQLSQLEFYTAGTIPDMMLGVPETWTPEQIAQFQGWWDSLLAGNTAQRRQARFIPGGVNPIPLKDPKVKDEWDEWLARVICYAFSLSPQALIAQMNRATAETAEEQSLNEGLEPLKLWWKDVMDTVLAVGFNAPDLEYAYEDEEISDAATKINVWSKLVQAKIAMPNEAREAYGMEPIEGLDDAAMAPPAPPGMSGPPGFAPGGNAGDLDPNAPPGADPTSPEDGPPKPPFGGGGGRPPPAFARGGKAPPPPPPNGANKPNPFAKGETVVNIESLDPAAFSRFFELHGDALMEFIKSKGGEGRDGDRKRLTALARVEDGKRAARVQHAFDRHLNSALAAILAAIGAKPGSTEKADDVSRVITEADLAAIEEALASGDVEEIQRRVADLMAEVAMESGEMATSQVSGALTSANFSYGDTLQQVNVEAKKWAEDYSGDLITNINQTTLDTVRDLVADAIENGDTVDDLASELMANAAFGGARSEMIARTELAFANVNGNLIGWKATGEVESKEWIIAQDEYCDDCLAMNGKTVPIDEDFVLPDGSAVEGPPAHPNCRCDVLPVLGKAPWDEEEQDDPRATPNEMAESEETAKRKRLRKREYLRDQGGRFAEVDEEGVIASRDLAEGGHDIPRIQMPQIKGKHWPEFKRFLEDRGIESEKKRLPVAMLKPTQREIHSSKVKEMLGRDEQDVRDKRILVSRDGFIVDGHHHWAALLALDKTGEAKVRVIDAPIMRILRLAGKFPKVSYAASETTGDLAKNSWFQYVPRDEKGNWVSVGRAVNAESQTDHEFAAKYHEAKGKFFADKGKPELAEMHWQAAVAHTKAAEAAAANIPYKSINEAARAATSEAEAASAGAHKGTFMTKAQAAEKANSEESHTRAAQYHAKLRDKAAANNDFALADKHQAAADAHRDAATAYKLASAAPKGPDRDALEEEAKSLTAGTRAPSKAANAEQKTRSKGGFEPEKIKTPQGDFQFAPVGPTKWGDHVVANTYGFQAIGDKIANEPHEKPENTYHDKYHANNVAQFAAFRKALPAEESRAINDYQGGGYGAMNRLLRKDDPDVASKYTLVNIEKMSAGLARAGELPMPPGKDSLLCWRGMRMEHLANPKPGEIFTDHGFTSMSTSFDSAKDGFAGDVMLKIHVPKGARGIYMAGQSGGYTSQYENEIMMQRGGQFEILAIHRASGGGKAIVEVRYLGSKPKKVDAAEMRARYMKKHGHPPEWA